jgi:hypothetical protein
MTHDGLKLRLYLNGVEDGIVDAVGDIVPSTAPGVIGNDAAGELFTGIIDEAQIFNRALTDAEILAIYQAGAAGECKPDIFVGSITPSYEVVGQGFLVSTSIAIQDENGNGIADASLQMKTILPSGSVLAFSATTDASGQATISFGSEESGLYKFRVRKVTHPTRNYDPSLNVETTDTLLIPGQSDPATATPTPTAVPIELRGQGKRIEGFDWVRLNWRTGTPLILDLYRIYLGTKVLIATLGYNVREYTESVGSGEYTYQVCEAGAQNCSNEVTVRFPQ